MVTRAVVRRLAVCNKRMQIRNDLELVEVGLLREVMIEGKLQPGEQRFSMVPDIDPETGQQKTMVVEQWVPVFVEPGTVIDVTDWSNAGAYVNHGEITLLGPAEAKEAWEEMQREAAEAAGRKTASKTTKESVNG